MSKRRRKQKLVTKVCLSGDELFEAVRRMAWLKARRKNKRVAAIFKSNTLKTNTRIELVTKGQPRLHNMEALVEIFEIPEGANPSA